MDKWQIMRHEVSCSFAKRLVQEAEMDEFTKVPHFCAECGRSYLWSADDIAWKYEASPFLPCGHLWKFLRETQILISRMCAAPLVIQYEGDELIHTDEHPFCADMQCECHFDSELWQRYIYQPWLDGILTIEAGAALFSGR